MLTMYETPLKVDRRDSSRWTTEKILWWRPHHGRKTRSARLVERSLTSLAFICTPEDTPEVDTLLHPSDPLMGDRHGFRLAVVRRVAQIDVGDLVFAEILA